MEFVFWFFLILIAFIYFGYPAILGIISLLIVKRFKKREFFPKVSIVIPAHNEEKIISKKLDNCFSLNYPFDKLEIILVLDACTDNTKLIALQYKDKGIKVVEQKERKGKIAALNIAVPQAKSDIIVFSDANAAYNKESIKELVANFFDSKVGCVCGELKYIRRKERNTGESIYASYWSYEKWLRRRESRLGSLLVANGAIYAIRRELFTPIDEDLSDDFVNPIMIKSKSFDVIHEPQAVATEFVTTTFREEFNRKVRITCQGFKGTKRLISNILRCGPFFIFQFLFHKFLRWFGAAFLIFVFVSNIFIINKPFYLIIFALQIAFYLLGLWGYFKEKAKHRNKMLGLITYFCMINLAAMAGLFKAIIGVQTKTWEVAETTRLTK